jgi:hypothetical protein
MPGQCQEQARCQSHLWFDQHVVMNTMLWLDITLAPTRHACTLKEWCKMSNTSSYLHDRKPSPHIIFNFCQDAYLQLCMLHAKTVKRRHVSKAPQAVIQLVCHIAPHAHC